VSGGGHLQATAALLAAARSALRQRVAPALGGGDARYAEAMVANALAIAVRDLELGPTVRERERELLAGFYGAPEAALDELRRRLCRDLRAGAVEPARAAELRALLEQAADHRLTISNPACGQARQA
jgi:hypothetical protein